MKFVPRDASDEVVMTIIHHWVDILAAEDYEAVFAAVGYLLAYDEPGPACIRRQIKRFRSPEFYPGIEEFTVTDWRTAKGGNPSPRHSVTWFEPNSTGLVGVVQFDLPLNGKWSDLTADFVWFENPNTDEGYFLRLEEIGSFAQKQRELDEHAA